MSWIRLHPVQLFVVLLSWDWWCLFFVQIFCVFLVKGQTMYKVWQVNWGFIHDDWKSLSKQLSTWFGRRTTSHETLAAFALSRQSYIDIQEQLFLAIKGEAPLPFWLVDITWGYRLAIKGPLSRHLTHNLHFLFFLHYKECLKVPEALPYISSCVVRCCHMFLDNISISPQWQPRMVWISLMTCSSPWWTDLPWATRLSFWWKGLSCLMHELTGHQKTSAAWPWESSVIHVGPMLTSVDLSWVVPLVIWELLLLEEEMEGWKHYSLPLWVISVATTLQLLCIHTVLDIPDFQ